MLVFRVFFLLGLNLKLRHSTPTPTDQTLETFEDATRMECLTTGFLQQRKEWLSQLRVGRHDYETREN